MARTRRDFLKAGSAGLLGAALPAAALETVIDQTPQTTASTPGAPPVFGAFPAAGPAVTVADFAAAEKLMQVTLTEKDRAQAAGNWQIAMAPVYERRTGPKTVALEDALAPASQWIPRSAAGTVETMPGKLVRTPDPMRGLPTNDADIAFARVWELAYWIEKRQLSSERLTKIYLERLKRFQPTLRCVITLTEERALRMAEKEDAEIAAGHYRGSLHGIPWGAKDLVDTGGILTTYGAEPFRKRVPEKDATVVERLDAAGAVLVAKLSLGALALNDIWFGGQTMNPWLLEEGASGSSAGPGSAVAAGLVGFAIGSETGGSIVSPSMRCGVNGLRPTFGRVPRTGAMTLCWSLDKLGPMARCVEDTLLVLEAISGPDAGDLATHNSGLREAGGIAFDAGRGLKGLKLGYFPKWMQEDPATDVDRAALETAKRLGAELVPVELPAWPYDSLNLILFAEAGAAFEELTLSHKVDELKAQVPDAWPNTFRQARFLSAVDFVQTDRFRRKVAEAMHGLMRDVDMLLVPSLRDEMLVISNNTGHPSLTLRAGWVEVGEARSDWAPDPASPLPKFNPKRRVPYGVTLIGQLFGEGRMAEVGLALERAFGVVDARPAGF